jgi:nucleotide-binding universal stress UspA family protein
LIKTVMVAVDGSPPATRAVAFAQIEHVDRSDWVAMGRAGEAVLVIGRRGLGRMRGLPIGSVSAKVSSLAECPVVTVT